MHTNVNDLACLMSRAPNCGGYCKAVVFTTDHTDPQFLYVSSLSKAYHRDISERLLFALKAMARII